MKLSALDLNHVRALHFLLEEAHVGRAAGRLGITPAATSNALHRLREEFGDPLLVRVGRTFARSTLANQLRGPAREVIAAAERLVETARPFDPKSHDGTFVVSTADRVAAVLMAPIDRLLTERAPNATLHMRSFGGPFGPARADERGVFIAPASAHGMSADPLFTEDYVCVLRRGHPLHDGRFSVKRYAAAEHVLVAPRGASERGVVDDLLAEQGLTRRVSRVVTSFALALTLVEGTDRIVTLPSSFAAVPFTKRRGLVTCVPPLKLAPIQMQVGWPAQLEGDSSYAWFRALLHDAVHKSGLRLR